MRVVNEIPHPDCKITVFSWNNRYILKFEQGFLEQTYKINEYDVADEREIKTLISDKFIDKVIRLFKEMEENLGNGMAEL